MENLSFLGELNSILSESGISRNREFSKDVITVFKVYENDLEILRTEREDQEFMSVNWKTLNRVIDEFSISLLHFLENA